MTKTMRQQLTEFLIDLSEIYPIDKSRKAEAVITQYVDYLLSSVWNKTVNFGRLKSAIFDEYKYKSFPEPSFIKDMIPRGVVSSICAADPSGGFILLRLPDGYIYKIELTDDKDDDFIKRFEAEAIKKHGEGTKLKVFGKGAEWINNKIYRENQKEGEILTWD